MSYLAGLLLMYMNPYDSFLAFTNLIESPFLKSVCTLDLALVCTENY
jgi:hypothetical protein